MTAFLKLCYLQTLPHNNGNICPLALIPTSPDALTCSHQCCILPGIYGGLPPPPGDLTKGDPASACAPGARCSRPPWSLLLCCLNIVIDQVQLSAVSGHVYRLNVPQSSTPRRHAALYLWGLFRKVKRALCESSIRKNAGCLTCITDGVHWPSQQSVSRMRQGHNQVLVFTWRHAFTSDSVIDVYANVFGGGL